MAKEKQPYGTVLIKAASILDYLAESKEPQALNQIASATDITNSTTSKILDTLILIGYVKKNIGTKKYELGSALIKYANQYLANLDISKIAYPYLKKLQVELNETIHLGILEGDEILTINKIESQKPVVCLNSTIGLTKPLYCSAMGKAVLAIMSDDDINEYLDNIDLRAYTDKTITNKEELLKEIKDIRKNGYAVDNEEYEEDVYCIGVALSLGSQIYGAFSVSVPVYRITTEESENIVKEMLKTKININRELEQHYLFL
ncbi:MAG: IclR family transcriptional regulator [Clostridiales bacterium]|nr:IclR family transcriptional regulator [Clostridiales bacterium]